MINLISSDVKSEIMYAKRNTNLLKWCLILILIIFGVSIISVSGIFYLKQSQKQYSAQITSSKEQLQTQNLEEVQKEIETISSNLKLTTQVLSKQILFSKLFKQIGAAMPPKTNLTDLKISNTTGGIDLSAIAVDYASASQVQVNLQDPANKIFDKADIVNIVCQNTSINGYPCTVNIRARYGSNKPFLFITPENKL